MDFFEQKDFYKVYIYLIYTNKDINLLQNEITDSFFKKLNLQENRLAKFFSNKSILLENFKNDEKYSFIFYEIVKDNKFSFNEVNKLSSLLETDGILILYNNEGKIVKHFTSEEINKKFVYWDEYDCFRRKFTKEELNKIIEIKINQFLKDSKTEKKEEEAKINNL